MKLWLELEPTPGMDMKQVAEEMVEARKQSGFPIQVRANGVLLLCGFKTTPEEIMEQYRKSTRKSP